MIEEQEMVNHWLLSGEPYFLHKHGVDRTYFALLQDVVAWIERYRDQMGQKLPSRDTVALEFDVFKKMDELDPIEYVVGKLREQKAYIEYRPLLIENSKLVSEGRTIEAIWQMKEHVDRMARRYAQQVKHYDWVGDAEKRFTSYLERQKEGLAGISTGIAGLDELTGGWREDDMILLSARINEGKSLMAVYFAYMAWRSLMKKGSQRPVIIISTEMPQDEVAFRLDTLRAHFSNRALNEGNLPNPADYKDYLSDLSKKSPKLLILTQDDNDGRAFTPLDIQQLILVEQPAFVVIDQLYDIEDPASLNKDYRVQIVRVTRQLREINRSSRVPMLIVAQSGRNAARAARANQDAMPELEDIQESDAPAQKATKVITLRQFGDVLKMTLKKNRGGKKGQSVFLRADIDKGVYEEILEEEQVF